jgi:uncharacterized membrane protein YkoI
MPGRKRLLAFTAIALLVAGTAAGVVIATSDDADIPITGDALKKASAAALVYTGGGTVTETEVGDEDGYYEVEVTMADGTEVDVHLDRDFNVIGSNSDNDEDDADVEDTSN